MQAAKGQQKLVLANSLGHQGGVTQFGRNISDHLFSSVSQHGHELAGMMKQTDAARGDLVKEGHIPGKNHSGIPYRNPSRHEGQQEHP